MGKARSTSAVVSGPLALSAVEHAYLLGAQLNLPVFSLLGVQMHAPVVRLLSLSFMTRHRVLPFSVRGTTLTLIMANPRDRVALALVRGVTGYNVDRAVGVWSEMQEALNRCFSN